jgi:hypothetical protein
VSAVPGFTALTRIPSAAIARVSESTAPLRAEWVARCGSPAVAAIDAAFTTAIGLPKMGPRGPRHPCCTGHVDVENAMPFVVGVDSALRPDAGVVRPHIEAAEPVDAHRDCATDGVVRDVGAHVAGTRGEVGRRLGRSAEDDHRCGLGDERLHDGQTDAGRATGHDRLDAI